MTKVYVLKWSVPVSKGMIFQYEIKEIQRVVGTKEKADDLYGRLFDASQLLGIEINIRTEELEAE